MLSTWPLAPSVVALVLAAGIIVGVGSRLVRNADELADRTGLGEAIVGAVLLGAVTSLAGIITTSVGAASGNGDFAVSNALGGIAVQTVFVAFADLTFRRGNLEHAAASLPNILQGTVLLGLLCFVLLAATAPALDLLGVHPVSPTLIVLYVLGLRMSRHVRRFPMWRPRETDQTVVDEPDPAATDRPLQRLLLSFAGQAAVVAVAGYVVGRAGISVAEETGLTGTEVAVLVTSIVTSLPELVVLVASVRAGALTLGIANIIGGNAFDVLFVPVADVAYRDGSVYHAMHPETLFVLALTLVMTTLLLSGLIRRQQGGIGFEGWGLLGLYGLGVATLVFGF